MKNQKEATVSAIMSVYKEKFGSDYVLNSETPISDFIKTEEKAKVREILLAGFKAQTIAMTEEGKSTNNTDALMKKYVDGLINNWLRKYDAFNGGNKYVAKNPGSRRGAGDDTAKALKTLLAQVKGTDSEADVQEALDKRLAEIAPTKSVEINIEALPESLRHLVKKQD